MDPRPRADVEAGVTSTDGLAGIPKILYACLSGAAGEPRDWDRFRSLFAPDARLVPLRRAPSGGAEPEIHDVEGYVRSREGIFRARAFYETETGQRVDVWRRAAHILSSYESRRDPRGPAFLAGTNSFQLFHDGAGWRIVSLFWDNGSDDVLAPTS